MPFAPAAFATTGPLDVASATRALEYLNGEAKGWPMCGKIPADTVRELLARVDGRAQAGAVRLVRAKFDAAFRQRGAYLTPAQLTQFAIEPLRAAVQPAP